MIEKGLYIHIPFCEKLCSYCDFAKVIYNKKLVDDYLLELKKELESSNIKDITSIYIGGGTPSSLDSKQLDFLLECVSKFYHKDISFTIEANVENLTEEKIQILVKHHINRVSLGIQSFQDNLLAKMNRKHTFSQVKSLIDLLHFYHIDDVNGDLIYGFKEESIDDLKGDLELFMKLGLTHISTYALMIDKNTLLGIRKEEEISQDIYRKEYDFIVSFLEKNGFHRYEVSNFAKKNYQSRHNLIYWRNQEYYGIGVGASGYIDHIRYDHTKSVVNYNQGKRIINQEKISLKDSQFYHLMLGLRLEEGINISKFNQLYNQDLLSLYKDKIEDLKKRDLIEIKDGFLKITKSNFYIMDYILEKLLF